MAPNGVVLLLGNGAAAPSTRHVFDPRSGALREVSADVRAINEDGVLMGFRPSGACTEAFLLFPDGSTRSLGNPVVATSRAMGCAVPTHHVAGLDRHLRAWVTWGDDSGAHPYHWDGTAWRLQPSPAPTAAVSQSAGAHAAGWTGEGGDRALAWLDGVVRDLGAGRAYAVNSLGVAAGEQEDTATVWSGADVTRLPLPAGWRTSRALAIGESGQVGGTLYSSVGAHAFLAAEGTTHDVNDLLDRNDLLATEVRFIARDGTIAGQALDLEGNPRAYVAIPTGAALVPDTSWRDGGEVLARGAAAAALAIDGDAVYWTAAPSIRGGWTLRTVAKRGGPIVTLADGPAAEHAGGPVTTGGGWVYFRTWDGDGSARIRRVRAGGGPVETVANGAGDFAADGTFLFLRDGDRLVRVPHAGGEPLVLDHEAPGGGLATDGVEAWYGVAGPSGGTIRAVSRDGGATRELFAPTSGFERIGSIDVDALHVYFLRSGHLITAFERVPRGGGAPERLALDRVARGFDADAQQVFYARPFVAHVAGPGCLGRAAADGSSGTCIDSGAFDYASPRADADAVYVIRDGDVVRLAR